jgi:cobalt-zinc-cadmium efflux system outer membrane protein
LPDQVRAYRGVLARRQIDPGAAFADLLGAQQTLAADVTAYLGILGSLWSSAVSVADLLQTDDLFQLAQPQEVPPLPDLEHLAPWPCCHVNAPCGLHPEVPSGASRPAQLLPSTDTPAAPQGEIPTLPAPKSVSAPPARETNWNVPLRLMRTPVADGV